MVNYWINTLLNCLNLSVEKGHLRVANKISNLCESELADFTAEQRSVYESLVSKVARMREIEDIHGKGCLLHLDDPLIVKMQMIGAISDREISAAKSYQTPGLGSGASSDF